MQVSDFRVGNLLILDPNSGPGDGGADLPDSDGSSHVEGEGGGGGAGLEQNTWATYTVVGGDTLRQIAERFGVDGEELIAWNSLQSEKDFFVGKELRMKVQCCGAAACSEVLGCAPVRFDVPHAAYTRRIALPASHHLGVAHPAPAPAVCPV